MQERSCMRRDSNMGGLGAKWACAWFKNSSRVFWSHVRSSHVLRSLSATLSLILNVSTCSIVCRRHDDPTNGPTGMELKTSSPVCPVAKESVWSPMRGMEDVLCCSSPHNPWIDDSFGFMVNIYQKKEDA